MQSCILVATVPLAFFTGAQPGFANSSDQAACVAIRKFGGEWKIHLQKGVVPVAWQGAGAWSEPDRRCFAAGHSHWKAQQMVCDRSPLRSGTPALEAPVSFVSGCFGASRISRERRASADHKFDWLLSSIRACEWNHEITISCTFQSSLPGSPGACLCAFVRTLPARLLELILRICCYLPKSTSRCHDARC